MKEETLCRQIADYIIMHYDKRDSSLFYGNTGISFIFYTLGDILKEPKYTEYADTLLDRIYMSLSEGTALFFSSGLAGIGWGLNYMVQKKYVEGNIDEILSDIDEKIYLGSTQTKYKIPFGIYNGNIGILLYLEERLKNGNKDLGSYRINLELFKFQISKLDEYVIENYPTIINDTIFDLCRDFPILFFFLSDCLKNNLFEERIINMATQWIPFIVSYIPGLYSNRICLALSLARLNNYLNNEKLSEYITLLLSSVNIGKLEEEFFSNKLWFQNGSTGMFYILKELTKSEYYPQKRLPEIQTLLTILSQKSISQLSNLNLKESESSCNLITGLTGSLLLFLLIENPDFL